MKEKGQVVQEARLNDISQVNLFGRESVLELLGSAGLRCDEMRAVVRDPLDMDLPIDEDTLPGGIVEWVRNQADALIHATRSAITEHGSKVDGAVIGGVEAALADLETAMKGDDKAQIEAKSKALEEAGQSLYAAAAAAAQPGAEAGPGPQGGAPRNDDVVDAEFTEVKDEDGKQG